MKLNLDYNVKLDTSFIIGPEELAGKRGQTTISFHNNKYENEQNNTNYLSWTW